MFIEFLFTKLQFQGRVCQVSEQLDEFGNTRDVISWYQNSSLANARALWIMSNSCESINR